MSNGGINMATIADEISFSNVALLLERRPPQAPIRYHAIPRFVLDSTKLQPRPFPYSLPTGRHHSQMGRPPALGLGNSKGLEENKDEETSQQLSSVLPPIEQEHEEKEELSTAKIAKSSDRGAIEEELLALPRHEKNADLVRHRAVRNEAAPEIWQKVACVWDRCQTRPNQFHQYEFHRLFPAIPTPTAGLEEDQETSVTPFKQNQELNTMPKVETSTEGRKLRFTRPIPGYGGYISRYPVEPRPPQGSWDEVFVNFSKLTYRSYPSHEYTRKEFAHKGPLSRLVTTTHPSNPFNKVDQWNSRPKKLWKRANHSKFV